MRIGTAVALLIAAATPAWGHMLARVGSLVDLIARSDQVVIGTVAAQGAAPRGRAHQITMDPVIALGDTVSGPLQFTGRGRPELKGRYLFFLDRDGDGLTSIQEPGALFPSGSPADDDAYRAAVEGVRRALASPPAEKVSAMRRTMLRALAASPEALRYHAALELMSLDHDDHPLSEVERAEVERIRSAPGFDPALRPLLDRMLARPDAS